MDRRDFLAGAAATGSLGLLSASGALGLARSADAASASESAAAMAELAALLGELETRYLSEEYGATTEADRAEGRSFVAHALQHAFEAWFEADPQRPVFTRFVRPDKRLLGDNPDALYYTAPVDASHRYRIRGNVAGADYTSFSVEIGTSDGHGSRGLSSTLNDTEFDVAADGSFELTASAEPAEGNWLPLKPGSGTLTTRHYFENARSIAADPVKEIPLVIEPLDDPGPPPPRGDAEIAAGFRRVTTFVRAITLEMNPKGDRSTPFQSNTPNTFVVPPLRKKDNSSTGFAAVDNFYVLGDYELEPEQALVIRGRFPRCRFANLVTWNRYMQHRDYVHRRTSLNRRQVEFESDGSYRIVVAHRDPGVPNWIDTEGRPTGRLFFRFLLPEEQPAPIETEVVKVSKL